MAPKEMFIVQKCWFDGPNVQPPQDYRALFSDRTQAEEVASRSAYMHAEHCQAVVRTILLGNVYAFSAGGDLFWIRSVAVDVGSNNINTGNSLSCNGAHAISNRGVIGGTGNLNSRRGSEVQSGVVFVGPDSHSLALQVLMRGGAPANSEITYMPFGPLSNLLDGWSVGSMKKDRTSLDLEESLKKRSAMQASNVVLHNEALAECSDFRPLKRHCLKADTQYMFAHPRSVEQIDAVMHSS